jgi:hypothetical protein
LHLKACLAKERVQMIHDLRIVVPNQKGLAGNPLVFIQNHLDLTQPFGFVTRFSDKTFHWKFSKRIRRRRSRRVNKNRSVTAPD